ncbi:MAG TPA: hypothetical protein VE641_06485 [Chthoniobacterales bacterium]|nr:hypothetical protein [Chthoniobacterales bacterium]
MDIYRPTASVLLILNVFQRSRLRIIKYMLLVGGALAMSGCLSLRLGSNDKRQPTVGQSAGPAGRSAGTLDVANSMAEASGGG